MTLCFYAKRFFLFFLPLGVILGFPFLTWWKAGEFQSSEKIVSAFLSDKPTLVGQAYLPTDRAIGIEIMKRIHPNIVALGNSRVLEFRKKFFVDGKKFFDAGERTFNASDYRKRYLDLIPEGQEPSVIILGVEQTYFISRWTQESLDAPEDVQSAVDPFNNFMNQWPQFYLDAFHKKIDFGSVFFSSSSATTKIGLDAVVNHNGIRNDGSYQNGQIVSNPSNPNLEDASFKNTYMRIKMNCCKFQQSQDVSLPAVQEMDRFLQEAERRHIYVVGFLPPYPHIIYQKMLSLTPAYSYIQKLPSALQPIFAKHHFPLFNFTDLATTGATTEEMIDGLHASEKAELRIWIKMVEQDPILQSYANLPQLKKDLQNAPSDYQVYDLQK